MLLYSDLGYQPLNDMIVTLLQLERAEYWFSAGDEMKAIKLAQNALQSLKLQNEQDSQIYRLNIDEPTIEAIVANYRPVLERDLWLVFGDSLAALGQDRYANIAYQQVLKLEPKEWRAWAGLLHNNQNAPQNVFKDLVTEANIVLKLEGWTDQLELGYPDQFFLPEAINELRSGQE